MPENGKKPTLADVAQHAGVSITTASLALTNKGRISQDVRDRVTRSAEEVGYAPRKRRRTRAGVTAVLGLVNQEWAYAWRMHLALLRTMTERMEERGRSTCVVPVRSNDSPGQIMERLKAVHADSVYSIHYANESLFDQLEAEGVPTVIIMNNEFQTRLNSVCVDDFQGAYDAGRVLVSAGHRRIAYVSAELPMLAGLRVDRLMGLQKCLDEEGIPFPESNQPVVHVHHQDEVDAAITALMRLPSPPTALYVLDDYLGVAVLESARRLNMSIPADLSIICAGDVLDYSEPYVPRISTMSIPFETMGDASISLMDRRLLEVESGFAREVLKVNQVYIDRGSIAAPPS